MIERNWIAETFGLPMLTRWDQQRFPLPRVEQLGLMGYALLAERRPGVYIIEKMSGNRSQYTVRVGSVTTGTIYQRLREHSNDRKITRHRNNGLLGSGMRVFWTRTEGTDPQGIEKYLERILDPAEGLRYPKKVSEVTIELPQPIRDRLLGIVREPLGLSDLVY